jgi:hypothetical protein
VLNGPFFHPIGPCKHTEKIQVRDFSGQGVINIGLEVFGERSSSVLMTATGASLSLALNIATTSMYPSLAVVLWPCVLLNSQRTLQWDSIVGENYNNKKKIFKAFSTFSSSSSSSFGATTGLSLCFFH